MSALNLRHFEQRQSASERATLLAAVAEVGLDTDAAAAFLDTDELADAVWRSYGATIREKGIHSIPLFAFHDLNGSQAGECGRRCGKDRQLQREARATGQEQGKGTRQVLL